ncbi:amidase [Skermania sp. ID1734]|uniref:amidase n=1 Tax=Skermania sp. ID1734 TaxID=2597516 RepID=UPI0011804016|nr:amidase family protein [Skermania sp. ID1734]TSD95595.1 amidase [Skermania sp. ID1734]
MLRSGEFRADDFTATSIATRVRAGELDPVRSVQEALDRIAKRDSGIDAFIAVRGEAALAEAKELSLRRDLPSLPMAGVPVAVKDNIAVKGLPLRMGSRATAAEPSAVDHPVVARLREAGAVIVGLTAMPELGIWGTTDSPGRVTRNPWDSTRTAGGSSGGAAAAVSAGMVPIAHGNDGLGSIRIPSACCGLFGIKPGSGLVPSEVGRTSWFGMTENGPLATTVGDAALMLSVLAQRPELAALANPKGLRIGLAAGSPTPLVRVDRHWTAAARTAGSVLVSAGHLVETTTLPYQPSDVAEFVRWTGGAANDAEALDRSLLQKRNRRHVAVGRVVNELQLVRPRSIDRAHHRLQQFFATHDVVITPTLAQNPPKSREWSEKGWLANILANVRYAPFAALWNLLGWPAASVPVGLHPVTGTPMAAQLAGPPGSEAVLLALAAQIEAHRPWQRVAPEFVD